MRIPLSYFIKQGPWALMAALAPGLTNYIIVIIFTRVYGAYSVGQFRLLLSIVGILGIFSLLDTGRILLKSIVVDKGNVVKLLFVNRVKFALFGGICGVALSAYYYSIGNNLFVPLLISSIVVPIYYPTKMFEFIYQAFQEFRGLAVADVSMYASVIFVFAIGSFLLLDVELLLCTYFFILTVFTSVLFSHLAERLKPYALHAKKELRNSVNLSMSGVFVVLLRHADKLIVSYFLGVEALGLYTIGISTGNIISYAVRPSLTILNPLLVKDKFTPMALFYIFAIGTIAGVIAVILLEPIFVVVFGSDHLGSYDLSKIIIWGLGIYCVGNIFYSTHVYNEDSPPHVPVLNNIISPVFMLIYLLLSVLFGGEYALVLCALSYPLRHLVNVIILAIIAGAASSRARV